MLLPRLRMHLQYFKITTISVLMLSKLSYRSRQCRWNDRKIRSRRNEHYLTFAMILTAMTAQIMTFETQYDTKQSTYHFISISINLSEYSSESQLDARRLGGIPSCVPANFAQKTNEID